MNDSDRMASLERRVIEVIEETTGVDIADADRSALFIDLGLDSLSLTQISIQLKQVFKVNISFRQLMEKYRSLESLATFLDAELPAQPRVTDIATVASTLAGTGALPTISQPGITTPGLAPSASLVEQVIAQQMQLMTQQLAMLKAMPKSRPAAAAAA